MAVQRGRRRRKRRRRTIFTRPTLSRPRPALAHGYVKDASEPRTKLANTFNILLSLQTRDLDQGPHLDGSDARPWNANSDGDRLVRIFGLDQEVTGELFASLHERTIGHERFTVAHPHEVAVAAGCRGEALRALALACRAEPARCTTKAAANVVGMAILATTAVALLYPPA